MNENGDISQWFQSEFPSDWSRCNVNGFMGPLPPQQQQMMVVVTEEGEQWHQPIYVAVEQFEGGAELSRDSDTSVFGGDAAGLAVGHMVTIDENSCPAVASSSSPMTINFAPIQTHVDPMMGGFGADENGAFLPPVEGLFDMSNDAEDLYLSEEQQNEVLEELLNGGGIGSVSSQQRDCHRAKVVKKRAKPKRERVGGDGGSMADRKKQQNRKAAQTYRIRKEQERAEREDELETMKQQNAELRTQIRIATSQIEFLKKMFDERKK